MAQKRASSCLDHPPSSILHPRLRLRHPLSSILHPRFHPHPDAIHAEGAGAATADAPPTSTSLATLLSRHILRDGEIVLLLLKPSVWFIVLSSLRFTAVVLLLMGAVFVFDLRDRFPFLNTLAVIEGGLFLITGRVMSATLQWTARLYVLTDLRILTISGVFNVHIFACALRKVARTRILLSTRDRMVGVGSIEIIPLDEDAPVGLWHSVGRPRQVHEQIVATINRAKQGCAIT
ncbi:MAG: hypothetical protein ABIP55_08135 [Tepidisphaeraceae bacterium]